MALGGASPTSGSFGSTVSPTWFLADGFALNDFVINDVSGDADLDGDGWVDLIVSAWAADRGNYAPVLFGPFTTGTVDVLADAHAILADSNTEYELVIDISGDANGDGLNDILFGNTNGSVSLLLGGGR